jgi:hypothetical protein
VSNRVTRFCGDGDRDFRPVPVPGISVVVMIVNDV